MPVEQSDIKLHLSGGAGNTNPAASLGGARSTALVSTNIFDAVSASQAAAGSVEHRCVYAANDDDTDTLVAAVAWLSENTANAGTTLEIGLGTSAANGTEQTVASESTAPTGVTFTVAATKGAGIALGDLGPDTHRAIWLRRTVTAGAAASSDTANVRVEGEAI
jgi:hypothetical protein